ncbi:class I SAM-dependent methyltransferase [Rhizomonospora bruguierae]|uniref:class I SAM-dependent methyltransferase n=1 Tax=Rhizomonospora bruguierae TaxID=1581705 RepID=UPI001BCA7A36|nr:class I SAM-dependent methyltransferase [Micromonospora sp. NBRC 107566]
MGEGNAHGHAHVDWAVRGPEMIRGAEVVAPMVNRALEWLAGRVPGATAVLDVGSGPGVAACTLATLLPAAKVLAVDGAGPLLDLARERADRLGLGDRFEVRRVSLPDGLADLPPADLVWVSGVAHHLPDPVGTLRALGRLLRPGGLLALREGGLPHRFLPDGVAPGLLPRLEAAEQELVAAHEHPMGVHPTPRAWPELFREAGLTPAGTRSFLLDLPAPLDEPARRHVRGWLEAAARHAGDRLPAGDAEALDRLLDDDSPGGVLRRPDLFLLTAATVHTATS